jgi:hypothetical protein
MSSKKAMKKMQKLAFQQHKNNFRNNKFKPKTKKFFTNIKNEKIKLS